MKSFLLVFACTSFSFSFAQNLPFDIEGQPWKNYKLADSLYNAGKLKEAIPHFVLSENILYQK